MSRSSGATNIDKAVAFARGDSYQHLADLTARDRDTAELGARRCLAFLQQEGLIEFEPASTQPQEQGET